MKSVFLSVLLAVCCISSYAQSHDLSIMKPAKRDTYLIKLAKEVVKNFGPDYYQKDLESTIFPTVKVYNSNDKRSSIQKNVGRRYYVVTLEDKHSDKSSEVLIWEDNGEPAAIHFSHSLGRNFYFRSYKQWIKEGVKDDEKAYYDPNADG